MIEISQAFTKDTVVLSSKISRQQLLNYLNKICSSIESISKIVQQQQKLDKYLAKAQLTRTQVIQNFFDLITHLNNLKPLIKSQDNVNLQALNQIFSYIDLYISQKVLNTLSTEELAVWIVQFQCKFMVALEFLDSAVTITDDIAFQEPNQIKNPYWQFVNFNSLGDDKKLKDSHDNLEKMTTVTAAAVLAEQKTKNIFLKKLTFGSAFSKYMLKYNEAQLIAMGFYRKPEVKLASKIWNTPQMGVIKQMSKIVLESIATNQKIWIPVQKFQFRPDIHKKQNQNSVSVRVLYHKNLKFYHKNTSKFQCCRCQQGSEEKQIDTIMVHMHGGGFIAMSSSSMQIYTRKWANYLKIPIFSIDYRMPPEYPFPQPALDCLAVYEFLINHISYYMNIRPKNIILAGDSAGGNLAASLTIQIMKKGLLMPKSIFLAYPALDLRKQYSPALFNSFTDPLLKPSVLLLCLNEYLNKDINNSLNPVASPLLATQQYLYGQESKGDKRFPLKWPKTIIFVGKKDPLYDDTIRLGQKLYQNKTQFKIKVYQKFSHGFFNLSFIIPQCDKIIKDSSKIIKEQLLSFIQKNNLNEKKCSKSQNQDQEIILKTNRDSNLNLVQSLIKKQQQQVAQMQQQ